jgi:hypothetical protein
MKRINRMPSLFKSLLTFAMTALIVVSLSAQPALAAGTKAGSRE